MYWANPDTGEDLSTYLDGIVEMMVEHGGIVTHRGVTDASDDQPLEIHMCQFESEDELDNFMGDARRVSLSPERVRVIARMEIMRMTMKPVLAPATAGSPE